MKDTPKTKQALQHTWEHTAAAFDKSFRASFENTWVLVCLYMKKNVQNGHQPFAAPPQEGD